MQRTEECISCESKMHVTCSPKFPDSLAGTWSPILVPLQSEGLPSHHDLQQDQSNW
jgi:hypothetical protein